MPEATNLAPLSGQGFQGVTRSVVVLGKNRKGTFYLSVKAQCPFLRRSNKGFLPILTAEYLTLLDWTARQTRSGKRGATPKQFAPLFDRLGISAEIWCRLVKDFGRLFSVVAGQPQRIDEHRSKDSSRRYRTRQATRELLATV